MRIVPLVLVAANDASVASTLVQILEGEGLETISASDGAAAVQSAREKHPDILICDLLMPAVNGVEAAKRIQEFLPQIRIILFSAHPVASALKKAQIGKDQFEIFAKPVEPKKLLGAIRRFMGIQ